MECINKTTMLLYVGAVLVAVIAYALVWKQASSFNTCLAIWQRGYAPNAQPAVREMLYMQGHGYCSGGERPDDGAIGAWLKNREGA